MDNITKREKNAKNYIEKIERSKIERTATAMIIINLATRITLAFIMILVFFYLLEPTTSLQVFAIIVPGCLGGVFFSGLLTEIEGRLYNEITKSKAK